MKIVFSIFIVTIAYTPAYFHLLLKLTGVFYIVSFVFGGAAFGLFYFVNGLNLTSNGISFIKDFPIRILVVAVVVSYFTIRYSWDYIQHRIKRERIIVRVELIFDKRQLYIDALVDTGNSLKDPITNVPVMITDYSMIKELLPDDIQMIFEQSGENDLSAISEIMSISKWVTRFRLIPFKSLGKENGMLIGFKPDEITIHDNSRKIHISNIVVAIFRKNLSADGEYGALIHPEMLKEN
jgi:stage II sporulation protein GA (sporulation sigma-E factor processing peptidase)